MGVVLTHAGELGKGGDYTSSAKKFRKYPKVVTAKPVIFELFIATNIKKIWE